MDLRKIKKLIDLGKESGISELEVTTGDESIRVALQGTSPTFTPSNPAVVVNPEPSISEREQQPGQFVEAPMAGTFYCAPAPGAEPFVREGQSVSSGAILCIIESMKMMNQIESPGSGTIVQILVKDGLPIETGTPLLRIE